MKPTAEARRIGTALGAALLAMSMSGHAAVTAGDPAPAFSATNSQGETVQLKDYAGQYVMLEWTNHDCPFVRKHYNAGNMQDLQSQARDKDIAWLSIISSAPGKQGHVTGEQAETLTRERNAQPSHVLFDASGDIGRAYGAKTTPHMYLIDPAGKLVYVGGIDSIASADAADIPKAVPYTALAMQQAAAGEPISTPVSRPYGCSVKY